MSASALHSYGTFQVSDSNMRIENNMYSIENINPILHASLYNTLSSVEEANLELLQRTSFSDFLKKMEEIVLFHGLEDYVGLRLIHRHFKLIPGQVMLESFEHYEMIPSLVTSACDITLAQKQKAVPSGWIFSGTEMLPTFFEFSTDEAIKTGVRLLQNSFTFFPEVKATIKAFNFQDLIAVALLRRDNLSAEKNQIYMEKNYHNKEQSVVQLMSEEAISHSIKTAWSFSGARQARCRPESYCAADEYGRHDSWEGHTKVK